MRELLYTILELEEWNRGTTCDFCSNLYGDDNKAICQIRTRNKLTDKIVDNACACEECKEKFENDELLKCDRCGRLQTKHDIDVLSDKYVCNCKENLEEKELSPSPPREGMASFYERQINTLQEEKTHLAVEAQSHLDAMETFEVYNKKHRQELLDRIKELEEENERLKKQTPQELIKEIEKLKKQLEEVQLIVQTEVPSKRQRY